MPRGVKDAKAIGELAMTSTAPVVFLLDVDNTLLDNDQVADDLRQHLTDAVGFERQQRYWTNFEELRSELGYADYLGALQRYRIQNPRDPHLIEISYYLLDYPFADRLYAGTLDVIKHLSSWGPTVILSDGDVVFQPRKVQRSGLFDAVAGRVLIYIHKENELEDVQQRFPAEHYVMVDDKLRILSALKQTWRTRVTTVFPRQGHYANDPKELAAYQPADLAVDNIRDLLQFDKQTLLGRSNS
jgi:FMN phosphatase YigB (HAD superfamily)